MHTGADAASATTWFRGYFTLAMTTMIATLGYFGKAMLHTLHDLRSEQSTQSTAQAVLVTTLGPMKEDIAQSKLDIRGLQGGHMALQLALEKHEAWSEREAALQRVLDRTRGADGGSG